MEVGRRGKWKLKGSKVEKGNVKDVGKTDKRGSKRLGKNTVLRTGGGGGIWDLKWWGADGFENEGG